MKFKPPTKVKEESQKENGFVVRKIDLFFQKLVPSILKVRFWCVEKINTSILIPLRFRHRTIRSQENLLSIKNNEISSLREGEKHFLIVKR